MTNYWIGSVNSENYKIVRGKNLWGVNSSFENSLRKTSKGDKLVFYIHGKKLGGAFEVDSEIFPNSVLVPVEVTTPSEVP